jgi:hypothetical protein
VFDVLNDSEESLISRINSRSNYIIVDNFLEELYKYYNKYGICIWFSYDEINEITINVVNGTINYTSINYTFDVIIPDQIINSNNTDIIKNFIKDEINKLINGLHMPTKFVILNNFLIKVKKLFNEQIIRKEKIINNYEITHTLKFNFEVINDEIIFRFKSHGLPKSNSEIHLLLSEIYNENDEINFASLGDIIFEKIVSFIYSHYSEYKCCECGNFVKLYSKDIKYYLDKEFELPKRCKCCRDKRKQNKHNLGGIIID